MSIETTPWAIGGGALHSPEIARTLAFQATGGGEGVGSSGALRVAALPVPGGSVTVAPGTATIRSRYAGGDGQSYVVRVPAQRTIPIMPTGSSGGRTDLIVARIVDPQYEGQPPADPNAFEYLRLTTIPNVPASADAAWLRANTTYPAIILGRVTLPANTGTVTAAMLTDARTLAQPRRHTGAWALPGVNGRVGLSKSAWVTVAAADTMIPEWATRAHMSLQVNGLIVRAGYYQGHLRIITSTPTGGNVRTTRELPITEDVQAPRGSRISIGFGDFIEGLATHAGALTRIAVQMKEGTAETAAYLEHGNTTYSLRADFIEGAA